MQSEAACEMSAAAFFSRSVASPALGRIGEVTQAHLPPHAQDIYREAFNHAFAAHAGDPYQEERAHRIAWAAVKRSYVKVGGSWIGRDRT
jgi:cation transport regulator